MIDIHSHFLFGVDDGPETIEDSARIIEKAVKEGITDMIATPHAFSRKFHASKEVIEGQIKILSEVIRIQDYPVTLHTGHEVRLHEHILEKLNTGETLTLAGSRYLLLELPSHSVPYYTINVIQTLIDKGIIPIIAHPERNRGIVEKPEQLEKFIRHGALAQVTAGSLSGHFGKNIQKISIRLIEANLIHTYGSDVHNLDNRPFLYNEGLDYLEKKKQYDVIELLLENNERILKDEPISILDPETPTNKKWWKLLD